MERFARTSFFVAFFLAAATMGSPARAKVNIGRLAPAASMHDRRADHIATLLRDGRVLITGGMVENGVFLNSAELYDPAKQTFITASNMAVPRVGHSATRLPDGKVLVAGGLAGRVSEGGPGIVATTEIYDPVSGKFSMGPPMSARRSGHAAILLQNGTVLIAGGSDRDGHALASAEIYDPVANRFTPTGSMVTARAQRAAVLLKDGRVLFTGGGEEHAGAVASAETYDPAMRKWQPVENMIAPREKHAAALLADGRVLIMGGSSDWQWHPVATAEVFDPHTGKFSPAGNMEAARFKLPNATAALNNGDVLVAGGASEVELYDAARGRFLSVGSLDGPHYFPSATLLRDGSVLITGGYDTGRGRPNGPLSSEKAWLYKP